MAAGQCPQRAIRVTGAGDDRANGTYVPVDSLPPDAHWSPGRLIWRHESRGWLHITYGFGSWWIGHYRNCVEDLYVTAGGDQDTPPVGTAVVWGFKSGRGDRCCGGGGRRPLPCLRWQTVDEERGSCLEAAAEGDEERRLGPPDPPGDDAPQRTFLIADGAGEELVNGVYVPVESLPPDAGWTPGALLWKHGKVDWLYLTFGDSSWWLGHYRYGVRDLYVTDGGRGDTAPVGGTVTWGWRGAGGQECIDGRGERPFPELQRLPTWLPIEFDIVREHLMRPACKRPVTRVGSGLACQWSGVAEELPSLTCKALLRLFGGDGGRLAAPASSPENPGAVVRGVLRPPWLGWNGRAKDLCSSEPLHIFPAACGDHNAFSQVKHHRTEAPLTAELWSLLASVPALWQLRGLCQEDRVATELNRLVGADLAGAVGRGTLRLLSSSLWAGSGGTRTPLHRDYAPALVLQVAGAKRFLLSSPEQVAAAVARGLLPAAARDSGNTDSFCVNGSQEEIYGLPSNAPARVDGTVAVLREGDCLLLPAGIYHDVECVADAPVSLSLTLRLEVSE